MSGIERAIIVVLDGVGVGALPDAWQYGDDGADTLGNVGRHVGGLHLPHLERLGLGCLHRVEGVACESPVGSYGRMAEAGVGKDTTVGHWELAGVVTRRPFPTYPRGFPRELIEEFERRIGRRVLGNVVASGTEIVAELGAEHLRTGYPIVYTSADSVFQIAAHEQVMPPPELYGICLTARELLQGEHGVSRVIARPFVGEPGRFVRTPRRRDFGLPPPAPTLLDLVKESGREVVGVGKIGDIFAHRGLTGEIKTAGNAEGIAALTDCLRRPFAGLVMANLVDFDMLYGHRNDVDGFGRALWQLDEGLGRWLPCLGPADALFVTADHGCDPTTVSTDHSREYVPVLGAGARLRPGVDLGERTSFADLGATVADMLSVGPLAAGESFVALITGQG